MDKRTSTLTRAAILLAVALVFQFVKMGQIITGSGINAVLIIASSSCGLPWAAAIGTITPFMSVILGVNPPALVPVVPFIAAGNILYATVYSLLKNRGRIAGVGLAALLKFGLLYLVVNYLIAVKPPIKIALSFPQLVTALIGGAVALIILEILKKANKA